jgi:hypothetical protein
VPLHASYEDKPGARDRIWRQSPRGRPPAGGLVAAAVEGLGRTLGSPSPADAFSPSPQTTARTLSRLLDPHRVAPGTLRRLEQIAGPSLLTSTYLRRREPLRILSLLATRAITDRAGLQYRADSRHGSGASPRTPGLAPRRGPPLSQAARGPRNQQRNAWQPSRKRKMARNRVAGDYRVWPSCWATGVALLPVPFCPADGRAHQLELRRGSCRYDLRLPAYRDEIGSAFPRRQHRRE